MNTIRIDIHAKTIEGLEARVISDSFELTAGVSDRLLEEAESLGLRIAEVLKYVIGDRFKMYSVSPPFPPMPVSPMMEQAERLMKVQVEVLANQGLLKCPNCTIRLTANEFLSGVCPHCQFSLSGEMQRIDT